MQILSAILASLNRLQIIFLNRWHFAIMGINSASITLKLAMGAAFYSAQCTSATDGRILDLGTKGSGCTPYARTADGRLTLKGAVRELLATEMLTALNVPTSSTFCVIETGESLERHDEPSPTRSAVLTRLLHSHIRIGSFQRLAYLRQYDNMEILLRHAVRHHYPELDADDVLTDLVACFFKPVSQQNCPDGGGMDGSRVCTWRSEYR